MALSPEAIIGLLGLLIMCTPFATFLLRRCRARQPATNGTPGRFMPRLRDVRKRDLESGLALDFDFISVSGIRMGRVLWLALAPALLSMK